ncbi:MAG: hypothetical protein HOH18_10240 [Kordiimonadaceae bacterium]|nr:hypothetical protein [Kordiimonadaceae bacterium]MBT6036839.1 hypothetical protein [Kordiimonadaceae bacterium]MBT7583281.1 hypothetical protein [Kordiimonadaceae bacterium]
MIKSIVTTLLTFGMSLLAFAQEPIIIKMGNVIGDGSPGRMPLHTGKIQKLIAKNISKYTDGQVIWEILDGKRDDIPVFLMSAMTAKGDVIQATNVPSLFMPRVPEMLIQSIPFLFESDEHSRRFMNSEPDLWMSSKVEETYNVKVLGSIHHSNAVSINSITPIIEPEDFGNKILNDFSESWLPLWQNIKPKKITYIGYAEAAEGALVGKDATTEVNIGMLQNNHIQRLYERYKHLTLVPNMYNIYYMILINNDVWNGLSEFQQDGINRAINDGQKASIAMHLDTMMHAIGLNQVEGVQFHFQTSAERERWKTEFYPKMLKSVIEKSSDPQKTAEMIDQIENLVKDLEWQ